MSPINSIEELEAVHEEICEALITTQKKVDIASDVDDFSVHADAERKLLERTIDQFGRVSGSHLAKLKTRLNMLVTINRLPAELLVHIIILTHTPMEGPASRKLYYLPMEEFTSRRHPYVPYTWVCHHWRIVLIQNPAVWTLIQHGSRRYGVIKTFDYELLQRSKAAKVDIIFRSTQNPSMFADLFARGANRIRRLLLLNDEDLIQLFLSGKCFPSLQALALHPSSSSSPKDVFNRLLPVLVVSDHLETLECTLFEMTSIKQLTQILGRIRNLSITTPTSAIFQFVLGLLHNSTKLYGLRLKSCQYEIEIDPPRQVVWPELRFLSVDNFSIMKYISAPKLRTLHASWRSTSESLYYPILEEFDFSSIRFLYIQGSQSQPPGITGHTVLGSKERISLETVFSSEMARGTEVLFEDIGSPIFSRDYFYFSYYLNSFAPTLQATASVIFPRLTGLLEAYLLYHYSQAGFQEVVTRIPSVEKVVIQRGEKLLDFIRLLNDTSVCPRLKHLSFTTFVPPKNLEKYANEVGKSLTKCLQLRQRDCVNELKYIALRNCPPLPDTWLEQIRELGTEVATESNIANVTIKTRKTDREQRRFSDVET